jgi:hypothetical protein
MGLQLSQREQKTLCTVTATGAVSSTNVGQTALARSSGGMILVCDVTAAGADGTDTLDVKVQTNLGGIWVDVAYFAQILGNGGTKRYAAKLCAQTAFTLGDLAGNLSAATIRNLIGDEWRVNYVAVSGNSAAFTFAVYAIPF